jgi:hypothetical protein
MSAARSDLACYGISCARSTYVCTRSSQASYSRSVHGKRLNAVGHEFEAEHEEAQATDDRYQNVFENINLHRAPLF